MLKGVTIKSDSTIYGSAVELGGYSLVRRDRVNNLGGGCVHILNHLFLSKDCLIYKMNVSNPRWLYLRPYKLSRGFSCLLVCVIYHPPANDNNALIDHITSKLDLALTKHPNAGIFLVGDFNRSPASLLLRHYGLKQIVKQPTRKSVTLDLTDIFVIKRRGGYFACTGAILHQLFPLSD